MMSLATSSRKLSTFEKRQEMTHLTAGGIAGERFKRGSRHFTHLSETANVTNLSDMTSLAVSGRLQKSTEYCTTVRKKVAADIEAHNSVTV